MTTLSYRRQRATNRPKLDLEALVLATFVSASLAFLAWVPSAAAEGYYRYMQVKLPQMTQGVVVTRRWIRSFPGTVTLATAPVAAAALLPLVMHRPRRARATWLTAAVLGAVILLLLLIQMAFLAPFVIISAYVGGL